MRARKSWRRREGDCEVVLSVVKSRDQPQHDFVTEILKAPVVISFIAFIFHSDPQGSNWRRLQVCLLRGRCEGG